jgi:hypothetical protein
MLTFRVSKPQWRRASRFSLLLSGAFLTQSLILTAIGVESNTVNAFGPAVYFIGATAIFLAMVRAGGALAPIAWYILGTGIFFGLGTAIWGLVPNLHENYMLHAGSGDVGTVNLLNSTSIFIVLLVAFSASGSRVGLPPSVRLREVNWQFIYSLVVPLAIFSVLLDYLYFPIAKDLLVRSVQSKLSLIVPMYLLMTGMLWRTIGIHYKALSFIIISSIIALGILSFSKTQVVYPLLCLLAGYWTVKRSLRSMLLPLVALSAGLVFLLIPLVQEGRGNISYSDAKNSLSDRMDILEENYGRKQMTAHDDSPVHSLARISHAPFQRYLIEEYAAGRTGKSLTDFWVALVPRIFWPDKPNVTRYGAQLHNLYFKTRGSKSALAPTYTAEAYWNNGSFGVLVISLLLGLQLGWFTRHWFYAIQGHDQSYLIIAFPAAFYGLNVETWIAASYFGGFITMVIMWWIAKPLIGTMVKRSGPRQLMALGTR